MVYCQDAPPDHIYIVVSGEFELRTLQPESAMTSFELKSPSSTQLNSITMRRMMQNSVIGFDDIVKNR